MRREYFKEIDAAIPIAESYRDCIELIASDYFRIKGHRASLFKMWLFTLVEPSFAFLFWLRLSFYRGGGWYLCKLMHRHYMFKYGLLIPSSTKIGYGFYIGHPQGIIINHSAVIGNNVNLSQFTTIGSNQGQAAFIGDDVYMGPSVCTIENVIVGAGSIIGAGSIVTKDIPPRSVAVGNPAKVIANEQTSKFNVNKWHY